MRKMILGFEIEDNKFEYCGFEGDCHCMSYHEGIDRFPKTEITIDVVNPIAFEKEFERLVRRTQLNSHYGLYGGATPNIIDTYITKIIFNGPATIVFFRDGSKEVVKCSDTSKYDAEKGVLYAFMKHMLNSGNSKKTYNNNLKMIDSATLTEEQRRANDIFWNYGKSDTQEPKKDDNVVKEE